MMAPGWIAARIEHFLESHFLAKELEAKGWGDDTLANVETDTPVFTECLFSYPQAILVK
jgi:hypothetical protein